MEHGLKRLTLTILIKVLKFQNCDDIPILPLTNTVEIYKYSDAILKHVEGDALKSFQNDLLYSNKNVISPTGVIRPKMLMLLTEQMTILTIDLTNFLINFRMNIIT